MVASKTPCPVCNDTGKVVFISGKPAVPCPHCRTPEPPKLLSELVLTIVGYVHFRAGDIGEIFAYCKSIQWQENQTMTVWLVSLDFSFASQLICVIKRSPTGRLVTLWC